MEKPTQYCEHVHVILGATARPRFSVSFQRQASRCVTQTQTHGERAASQRQEQTVSRGEPGRASACLLHGSQGAFPRWTVPGTFSKTDTFLQTSRLEAVYFWYSIKFHSMQAEHCTRTASVTRVRWAWLQKSDVTIVFHSASSGRTGQNTDKRHPLSSAAPQPRFTFAHGLSLGGLVLAHTDAHLNSCVQARRRGLTATLVGFSYMG